MLPSQQSRCGCFLLFHGPHHQEFQMSKAPDSNQVANRASSRKATKAPDAAPLPGSAGIQWSRISLNRLTYLFAASVCFVVLTVLAIVQPPRPTPYPTSFPVEFAFWAYPVVVNDIKRLPEVTASGASADPALHAVWVSGKQVWIAGEDGVLLHSPDAGATWKMLPPPPGQHVEFSQNRVWLGVPVVQAAGQSVPEQSTSPAVPASNTQSGAERHTSPPSSPKKEKPVGFIPQAANAPYQPAKTAQSKLDALQLSPSPAKPGGVAEPNQAPTKAGPAENVKRASATNSENQQQSQQSCSIAGRNLTAVYFDEETGYVEFAADQKSSPDILCNTGDGAVSWRTISVAPPAAAYGLAVSAASSATLPNGFKALLDPKGGIAISNGRGSITRPSHTGATLNAITFEDDHLGFAVGSAGTALKTTDGGETWFPVLQGLEGERLGDSQPHKLPAPWYYLSWVLVAAIAMPSLKKPSEADRRSEETIANIGVSDRPLEPGDADSLGYRDLALSISRFLRNENTIPPITLAITGEWGTGKSSIMNLLRGDLDSRGMKTIWFNAWHNQTEDDLFATILEAIRKQGVPQWWKTDYLPFGVRLLAIRWKSRWRLITVLLMATAFLVGIEWQHQHTVSSFFDSFQNWNHFINSLQSLSQDTMWALVICVLYAGKQLYDGLKAFGVDPAALLVSRSGATSLRDLGRQTALRQRFGAELKEVTHALGKRQRMVMFIDDLDRCMPENIRVVLEAVNFIVTSGECFVIMGMARRPVEAGIGLSFEQIAGEMAENAPSKVSAGADANAQAKSQRRDFSHQYLDKLINIEIPARPASTARYEDLVLENARLAQPAELLKRIASRGLKIILPVLVSMLLILSLARLGMLMGGRRQASDGLPTVQVGGPATTTGNGTAVQQSGRPAAAAAVPSLTVPNEARGCAPESRMRRDGRSYEGSGMRSARNPRKVQARVYSRNRCWLHSRPSTTSPRRWETTISISYTSWRATSNLSPSGRATRAQPSKCRTYLGPRPKSTSRNSRRIGRPRRSS
jgi:hypothetical protein